RAMAAGADLGEQPVERGAAVFGIGRDRGYARHGFARIIAVKSIGSRAVHAPGDGAHLARRGQPDRSRGNQAESERQPECRRVAAEMVVQDAGGPRTGGAPENGGQHYRAEDAAVMASFKDL